MKNPLKIIHKFKNNNLRTQYKVFIFVGSLLSDSLFKILQIIEEKDLISSLMILNNKQFKEISDFYGPKWYEKFFTSYRINYERNILKNNNSKRKALEQKLGKEFVRILLEEPVIKKVTYSYANSYYNYLLVKNKIKSTNKKVELDFRTNQTGGKNLETIDFDKDDLDYPMCKDCLNPEIKQVGSGDDDDLEVTELDLESIGDLDNDNKIEEIKTNDEEEEVEKQITEDDLDEAVEEDFNLDELTKLYATTDVESEKLVKETSKLISEAIHDKKWEKNITNIEYDDTLDNITFDNKIENIYKKY